MFYHLQVAGVHLRQGCFGKFNMQKDPMFHEQIWIGTHTQNI